jgi:phosphatidylglycerophosphatase A
MIRLVKHRTVNNSVSGNEPSLPVKVFASGFFTGYVPAASGTLGSVLAIALYMLPGFESPQVLGAIILLVIGLGTRASSIMEKRYGHDPSEVTIDEVVGMWISLFLLPKKLVVILLAFFVFRFFDIIKPYPARKFDSLHGGFSIMMDDVVAGVYTNIFVQILLLVSFLKEFLLR